MSSLSCTLSDAPAARGCSGRIHLSQAGHVRVAQHQADVWMRDQPPLGIDDIGMTALADLDLRDHIPDQLQIDLGDAYAGVTSCSGNSERHVRLGFPAEIDRSIVDFASHRLGELGFLRKVGPARHHVHGEA